MQQRPFTQVDVFTDTPYLGNPLAVVLDGAGLDADDMQHFARWTNLSETTFVLPPSSQAAELGADYRVRIFTPGGELPFAGHPTLGSCHAWLQAGGVPQANTHILQECAKGLITIRQDGSQLAFAAPALQRNPPGPALVAEVAAALGLNARHILASQLLDNGPVWLGLLVDSLDVLLALRPDDQRLKTLGQKVGLAHIEKGREATTLVARSNREARAFGQRSGATGSQPDTPSLNVRAFAAAIGVNEDPVTGSLNASLAQWLMADGLLPTCYIATQGTCLGRHGQVFLSQDDSGQVWVGGNSVTCIAGFVTL
ncbi:PhzF family phenazine biosynthesis protein [Rhodoferax sp. 4810]|nr:PhzF family phenazine biosynthesis protein [Rhodoferax jenense]